MFRHAAELPTKGREVRVAKPIPLPLATPKMTDLESNLRAPRCHRPRRMGPARPPALHARGNGRAIAAVDVAAADHPALAPGAAIEAGVTASQLRGPRRRSRIGYHRLRWRRPKSPCPRHWSPWIPGLYWL